MAKRRRIKPDPVIGLFDDFIKATVSYPGAAFKKKKR